MELVKTDLIETDSVKTGSVKTGLVKTDSINTGLVKTDSIKTHKSSFAISRRIFLDSFINGIFGALAGLLIYPLLRYLVPPSKTSQGSGSVEVNAAEIPIGKSKIVNYKENPTIVIHTNDGLFAMSAVCTHLGCIVQWDESSQEIVCPCHGAKYDLNGNVKFGPAPKPLVTVKANMSGEKIIIG